MASQKDTQTTGQVGEYLVAAELCRLGYIATTFTRNVPLFDILAIKDNKKAHPIQVKTISGSTWQFDAKKFLDISITGNVQTVVGKKKLENPELLLFMVRLVELGKDEFYLLRIKDLQEMIFQDYTAYLKKQGGTRPKAPQSTHTAVPVKALKPYLNNWGLLDSL